MMGKFLVIIRYLASTFCIVLFLWGCDRTVDANTQPQVVRKKVVVQKVKTAEVSTKQTGNAVEAIPTAHLERKAATSKVDKTRAKIEKQHAAKTTADGRTVIARKIEVAPPAKDIASQPIKQKKPAVRPKSDISMIMPSPTDNGAAPSDKLIAATSNATRSTKPSIDYRAYNGEGKIDPFAPLYKDKPVSVKKSKRKKRMPQTPLERIDISQLKLVGIIVASSGNRALVEESTGKGYVIKQGTYIGVNSGKVVNIRKEKVVVEEEVEDLFGKLKLRQREIKLPKPPGEF